MMSSNLVENTQRLHVSDRRDKRMLQKLGSRGTSIGVLGKTLFKDIVEFFWPGMGDVREGSIGDWYPLLQSLTIPFWWQIQLWRIWTSDFQQYSHGRHLMVWRIHLCQFNECYPSTPYVNLGELDHVSVMWLPCDCLVVSMWSYSAAVKAMGTYEVPCSHRDCP